MHLQFDSISMNIITIINLSFNLINMLQKFFLSMLFFSTAKQSNIYISHI